MNESYLVTLRTIGEQLDADIYPRVFNDGIVALSKPDVADETLSAETCYESQGQSGPAAGSREGAAGWQGPTGGPWPSSEAEPSSGGALRENYLGQLGDVLAAYPRTTSWLGELGLWLSVESSVLAGLDRRAIFLIAIPFQRLNKIKAWAFWTNAISYEWIGPRHTNAVDGSICAFNPQELTWRNGGCLVELIDQYTMWVFRHLHLREIGWWPGQQTTQFMYERLTEVQDNEWCGCGRHPPEQYKDCCKETDHSSDRFEAAMEFVGSFLKFKTRQPPHAVIRFLVERSNPPAFERQGPAPAYFQCSSLTPLQVG